MRSAMNYAQAVLPVAILLSCAQPQSSPTLVPATPAASTPPSATAEAPPPTVSSAPEPSSTPAPKSASSAAPVDITQLCADEIRRQASCKEEFAPLFLDMLVRLDQVKPPKDKAARDKFLAQSKRELDEANTPANIKVACARRQSTIVRMSAEYIKQLQELSATCQAKPNCKAYSECAVPGVEKLLRERFQSGE